MYGTLDGDPLQQPEAGSTRRLRNRSINAGSRRSVLFSHKENAIGEPVMRMPVLHGILAGKHHRRRPSENITNNDSTILEISNLHYCRNKSFVFTMLSPRSTAWQAAFFKWFISFVILADLVSYVISTEPDLTEEQMQWFHRGEGITSSIFLLEYIARIVTVTESRKYGNLGPIKGRLQYASTFPAVIDLVACIPFFLEQVFGWDLPTLTYLRAFRILRILKTSGFSEASRAVYRVIYFNRQILYVTLLICVGLVIITAMLMYYLRPKKATDSQDFKSIGSTLYLATLMLTGQGGPDGDLPWYTKGVVLLTGVFSVGVFALLSSMLTWGFEAEAERCARVAYSSHKRTCEEPDECDNWSFSSEGYSTDEEYFKIIAGGDDDDDEENEEEAITNAFVLADTDGSGSISLTEFLALSKERTEQHTNKISQHSEQMSSRLAKLEKKVDENSKKMDRICHLLETMQPTKAK